MVKSRNALLNVSGWLESRPIWLWMRNFQTLIDCCCCSGKRLSLASAALRSALKAERLDGWRQRAGSSTAAERTSNSAPELLSLTRPSSNSDTTFSATLTHLAEDR